MGCGTRSSRSHDDGQDWDDHGIGDLVFGVSVIAWLVPIGVVGLVLALVIYFLLIRQPLLFLFKP